MNFDDMKRTWTDQARSLDAGLRLDGAAVTAVLHARTATSLTRLRGWLWVEVATLLAVLLWLTAFLVRHRDETAQLVSASALHFGGLSLLVAAGRQLLLLARIDHGAPVVALQQQLDHVAVLRLRATCGALVLGPLLWLPALAVVVRGVLGMNMLASTDPGVQRWIVGNIVFGIAVVAIALFTAHRFGDRFAGSPRVQRLLRALNGSDLARARASLDELAAFERGDDAAA